jgi:DNA-binding NarL/FixJ family response regulator
MPTDSATPIRVIVADDTAIVRRSICDLLKARKDIVVVVECADFAQALQMAQELSPYVVILDCTCPTRLRSFPPTSKHGSRRPNSVDSNFDLERSGDGSFGGRCWCGCAVEQNGNGRRTDPGHNSFRLNRLFLSGLKSISLDARKS